MPYRTYLLFFLFLPACINLNNFDRGYLSKPIQEQIEIPFELYRGLILISAEVNGVTGKFLFDNGASYSCLNAEFAKRANIEWNSGSSISDGNNRKTAVKESTAKEISIKGVQFKETGLYLIDTKKFFPCKEDVDGIIGASIINKINWLIDFENKTLTLSSNPFILEGIDFNMGISSNNSSFVAFTLNDATIKAKIDFGYQGDLKLRSKEYLGMFEGFAAKQSVGISSLSISGLGKNDTTYDIYEGITMKKGEQVLPFPPSVNLTRNLKYKARLGLDFFKNYVVAVNSTQNQYTLRPYPELQDEDNYHSYGAAFYMINGEFKIIQVNPKQVSGLEIMEVVESIDGEPMNRFRDQCEMRAYLLDKREKQETLYLGIQGRDTALTLPFQKFQELIIPTEN